jgi:hypothetical protein
MTPQLMQASTDYSDDLKATTEDELDDLMTDMVVNSAVSAAAVLLMLVISLRLTGILRRRIFALRAEALELQERLPDIVERLRNGEKVDTDAELPEVRHGDDELGQLGQALNQARTSSLDTAVREIELYRGFERLLQRIARRTQLLIGMQLKRLGEMQRRHEDPEVLEGSSTSTTWRPGCAATRRTWSSSAAGHRSGAGAGLSCCWTSCARRRARCRTTGASGSTPTARPGCPSAPSARWCTSSRS